MFITWIRIRIQIAKSADAIKSYAVCIDKYHENMITLIIIFECYDFVFYAFLLNLHRVH